MPPRPLKVLQPSVLPAFYQRWVDGLLEAPIEPETRASCGDCSMLPPPGAPARPNAYFLPELKCCTYLPELPSFNVGAILKDRSKEAAHGRKTVLARLRSGIAVSPFGIGRSPAWETIYNQDPNAFGRSPALRCPHYISEGGLCGIWQYRDAVCSTWFCKHVRGTRGRRFWAALRRLLAYIERDLAAWCVLELGLGDGPLDQLTAVRMLGDLSHAGPSKPDGSFEDSVRRELWGSWLGKEAAYFEACFDKVGSLSWEELRPILAPSTLVFARLAQQRQQALAERFIDRKLGIGSFQVAQLGPRAARVWSDSNIDPMMLPRSLINVLPRFEECKTARAALRKIAKEDHLEIEEKVVERLVDNEILIPV